jgi:hypothetical protein
VSAEHGRSLWDDLVTAAVIGTERRPFAGAQATGQLGNALTDVREGGLLATAAAVWAYREAGREVPMTGLGRPDAAPADDRPVFTPGAVRALAVIVDDRRFRPILGEWLALALRAAGRLPGEAVPKLLDAVRVDQRPAAAAVAGPLAAWLAARNPNWAWAHEATAAAGRAGVAAGTAQQATTAPLAAPASDEAEAAAVAAFGDATAGQIGEIVASIPAPWSAAITVAGLAAMARVIERSDARPLPSLRDVLPHVALVIDPAQSVSMAALPSSLERIPEKQQAALRIYWAAPLANFAAIASFRASLHKEFQ